ncbi:MAG: VanZ family protein [Bacteroidales bacterium]|nr:VanZ family protein [Bacteroidales bacterium]
MIVDNTLFFNLACESLTRGETVRIRLVGHSMSPILKEGDLLCIVPFKGDVCVGDVVLFRYGSDYLLHRVRKKSGSMLEMQGDHCRSVEHATISDVVGVLQSVERQDGKTMNVGSGEWERLSRRSIRLNVCRNMLLKIVDKNGRKRLRWWYFTILALLMWLPLNGFDLQLNNYVLGIRADHLLHASVYIPCSWFIVDLFQRRRWWAVVVACGVGLLTESVQYILPYRGFDINDMVANTIGVLLGWAIFLLLRQRK